MNITASKDITWNEIEGIGTIIADAAHPETNVIMGVTFDDNAGDALRVTLIAVEKRADYAPVETQHSGQETPKDAPLLFDEWELMPAFIRKQR